MTQQKTNASKTIVVLTALGFLICLWLTYIHIRVHLDPFYDSVCGMGKLFNCDTAASSEFSTAFGVPIAVWGALYYLFACIISVTFFLRKESSVSGLAARAALFLLAATLSVCYLAVSILYVKSICIGCFLIHGINCYLAVVGFLQIRHKGSFVRRLSNDLTALKKSPWILAQLAALIVLIIVAGPLGGFPRYWEVAAFRNGPLLPHGLAYGDLPWIGAASPEITVEEYFDFECPACRFSHKKLRRLLHGRADRIRVIRHDMSRVECVDKDGNGIAARCIAARAAFCAIAQHRFWEFNDAFIADPRPGELTLRREHVLDIARRLGMDEKIFSGCLDRKETYAHAQAIHEDGLKRGVKATPTYFVGDKKMRSKELLPFIQSF